MFIRPYQPGDLEPLLALTIETFRPFMEESFPAMVDHDADLVAHQHGQWRQDYHRQLSGLHNPDEGRHVAVAVAEPGGILGYVAWRPDSRPEHAEIEILAVANRARRGGVGRALMEHACAALREAGFRYVELGTGGDPFHAPARALYEELGFHAIPVVAYLRRL